MLGTFGNERSTQIELQVMPKTLVIFHAKYKNEKIRKKRTTPEKTRYIAE